MSTVRNDRYDEISHVRDHYKQQEEELKARQKLEKQVLSENYEKSLNKVNSQFDKNEDARREQLKTAITDSDKKHTDDIQRIKRMHSQQIREDLERHKTKEAHYLDAYRNEQERLESNYNERIDEKQRSHSEAMQKSATEKEEIIKDYQYRHNEEVGNIKEDYQRKFEEERQLHSKQRNNDVSDLAKEYSDYRAYSEGMVDKLKKRYATDMNRQKNNYERLLDDKERKTNSIVARMREASMDGVDREKRQYSKAVEEREKALARSWESLQGRNDDQTDHLNYKIRELQEKNIHDREILGRMKNREVENIKIAYQDNIDNLLDERKNRVVASNELRYEQVAAAREGASQRIDEAYNFYKKKLDDEHFRNDSNVARLQRKLSLQGKEEQAMVDYRFKKMANDYARDRAKLVSQNKREMEALKSDMSLTLNSERSDSQFERTKMQEHYEARVAEAEVRHKESLDKMYDTHQNQLDEVRAHYENRLADMKSENDHILTQMRESREVALQNQKAAFEYRSKKMEEAYQNNLKTFDTRREQSIRFLSERRDVRNKMNS